MFKFDIDVEDLDEGIQNLIPPSFAEESEKPWIPVEPCREVSINDLLDRLPSQLSYSILSVRVDSTRTVKIARRDLFDARFQLISSTRDPTIDTGPQSNADADEIALQFIDAPSDLVPGVYEGGLKTWECSLDLVTYFHSLKLSSQTLLGNGERILEIGCGTAVPSLYLLGQIFRGERLAESSEDIHFDFQDYNSSVLELLTLPNIFLAWYLEHAKTTADSGEVDITEELKAAFVDALASYKLDLRFFCGSWESFSDRITQPYDLVYTSETIYRTENVPSLLRVLEKACGAQTRDSALSGELEDLTLSESAPRKTVLKQNCLCLVAAKVIYFGVGGGVADFIRSVRERNGSVAVVWEHVEGVARQILKINWLA